MTDYPDLKAERRLPDWRDPVPYAGIVGRGRAALAWELLRRDSDYRSDVHSRPKCVGNDVEFVPLTDSGTSARSGLLFR